MKLFLVLVLLFTLILPVTALDVREGDFDRDGLITIADVELFSMDLLTLAAPYRGDVNDDARVEIKDLQLLLMLMMAHSTPAEPPLTDDEFRQLIEKIMATPDVQITQIPLESTTETEVTALNKTVEIAVVKTEETTNTQEINLIKTEEVAIKNEFEPTQNRLDVILQQLKARDSTRTIKDLQILVKRLEQQSSPE